MHKININLSFVWVTLLLLFILTITVSIHKVQALKSAFTIIEVDVYHLCSPSAFASGVTCVPNSIGGKRYDPHNPSSFWLCKSNDPEVYENYTTDITSPNFGCGGEHYPEGWTNPVALDIEDYVSDVLTPEMNPERVY